MVTDWLLIVQHALYTPDRPVTPGAALLMHAPVHLAVYDAVVAIEGGYRPYGPGVDAAEGADVEAAVATAAYSAALGRLPPLASATLHEPYAAAMAAIPDGRAKLDGIAAGKAAAEGILTVRAGDRFNATAVYACSATPLPVGEFEPDGGCGTQPVGAAVPLMVPFTFDDPAQFRPDGPDPFTSDAWAKEFNEVKALGGIDSALRTPEQTEIVHFWNEHGYVFWNRNLMGLARDQHLGVLDTARLMAMVNTSAADAVIAGVEAKYFYRFWRPRTAVLRAGEDGNAATEPDPTWKPLLTVDHPEYPSGHSFWSGAVTRAVAEFFGTEKVELTIRVVHPEVVRTERTYPDIGSLMADVENARIWAGLHYRNSMREGLDLGERVAGHVAGHYFLPLP